MALSPIVSLFPQVCKEHTLRVAHQWVTLVFAILISSLWNSVAFAQSATGFPPFGSFQGFGPDTINLSNLNNHIAIPVVHKAGRGLPFDYSLNYDSVTIWSAVTTVTNGQAVTQWKYSNGWGSDPILGSISFSVYAGIPGLPQCPETTVYYTDGSGTVHVFTSNVSTNSVCGPPTETVQSQDGTGYLITLQGTDLSGETLPPKVLSLYDNAGNSIVVASSITDPNGNTISETTTNGHVFTDTLGMSVLTVAGSAPKITYTYTGPETSQNPNGTPETVTVNYSSYTVASNFGCSGINEYPPTANNLISSIGLPDGTAYGFKYELTPGSQFQGTGDVTGRISEIDLPTGGSIKYQYSGGCGGSYGLTRTTLDGTWTYSLSYASSITTVQDPAGNQTLITFGTNNGYQPALEVQRSVYQGSSTLLETITTCYNNTAAPCTTATNSANDNDPAAVTVIRQPAGGKSAQTTTYYGVLCGIYPCSFAPTEIDTYDFGASSPTQVEKIAYASFSSNILNRPSCVQVTAGSNSNACGTVTSNTESLTNYSYFSNGNLQQTSSWVSGSNYLNRSFTYYSNGLMQTSTDVNSSQTTYGYQNCNNTPAYLSSVSAGGLTTSYTWDCNGGVITQISDANSQPTSYGYVSSGGTPDPFWRVNSVTDPLGNVTWIAFTPATSTTAATVENYLNFPASTPTSTVDTLRTQDGLGRLAESQKRTAPGATTFDNTVQYGYGWTTTGTVTGAFTTQTITGGSALTTTQRDALGRVVSVTDGGGGTLTSTYSQNDVLTTLGPAPSGEHTKGRQLQYDALGRVTSVCEILSSGGSSCGQNTSASGYLTSYAYTVPSAGGSQLTVTQSSQTRTYVRDGLGRLLSETNPESGTTKYTYDSDSSGTCPGTYNGDLVKRVDNAGNVSCYTYDGLHRKLSTTYSGPNATTNRYFVYDAATVNGQSMANAKGRLAEGYTAISATGTKVTDEGFGYSARGELANYYQSSPNSGGYYSIPITYWADGLIASFGPFLKEDEVGFVPDGEGRAGGVYDYTYGSDPVPPYIKYNAASQPTQLQTSCSGTTCYPINYQYDPNTLRMTQYSAALNGGTISGTLNWNPNGSLQQLTIADPFKSADVQTCNYSADDLGRIASVNCVNGSTNVWGQTFTYDAFGNVTKSGSISWMPGYNSGTNQYTLSGTSYDADGNITNDSFNKYTWDAEGKPLSGEGNNYLYDAFGHMVELTSGTYYKSFVRLGDYKLQAQGQTPLYSEYPLPGGSLASEYGGLTGVQLGDWLGSSRAVWSYTGGNYIGSAAHAPFGEGYVGNLDFTGQENDGNFSNLTHYFPERQYRSSQGRWLSPDPAGLAAADIANPQSWNRYAYVMNNPLALVDPSGQFCNAVVRALTGGGCDLSAVLFGSSFGSNWNEFDLLNFLYPYEDSDERIHWFVNLGLVDFFANMGTAANNTPTCFPTSSLNWSQKAQLLAAQFYANLTGWTFGFGAGLDAGAGIGPKGSSWNFGVGGSASTLIVADGAGNSGFLNSASGGFSAVKMSGAGSWWGAGAAAGPSLLVSPNPISTIAGPSGSFSAGGGAVLGAGISITTSGAATVTFGVGAGAEAGVSPQFGTSQFVPFCHN